MTVSGMRAGDTAMDAPLFMPNDEHERLLEALLEARHERDTLQDELESQRRELERARKSLQAAEQTRVRSALGVNESASRELQVMREAVARKDGELQRFREGHATLEKLVAEARERINGLKQERAKQDRELVVRDRALAEIDRRFVVLEREADGARRGREIADAQAIESRAALAGLTGEVANLRIDRDRLAEEVRVATTQRDDDVRSTEERMQAAMDEFSAMHVDEMSRVMTEYERRLELMGEAHAHEVARLARSHDEQRQGLEGLLAQSEGARLGVLRGLSAELRDAREELARERHDAQATLHARVAELTELRDRDVDELHREQAHRLAELTLGHAREVDALRSAHADELDGLMRELAGANADLLQELESARSAAALERTAHEAAHAGALHNLREEQASTLRHANESHSLALDGMREEHARAIASLTDSHADAMIDAEERRVGEIAAVREEAEELLTARLDGVRAEVVRHADARVAEVERRTTAEIERSIAEHAARFEQVRAAAEAESEARRVEHAEAIRAARASIDAALVEANSQREKIASQLVDAMQRLRTRSEQSQRETSLLMAEAKRLATCVGELTTELVVQSARAAALRRGRALAEPFDVDEALTRVSELVPDHIAESLWASRVELSARIIGGSEATRQGV